MVGDPVEHRGVISTPRAADTARGLNLRQASRDPSGCRRWGELLDVIQEQAVRRQVGCGPIKHSQPDVLLRCHPSYGAGAAGERPAPPIVATANVTQAKVVTFPHGECGVLVQQWLAKNLRTSQYDHRPFPMPSLPLRRPDALCLLAGGRARQRRTSRRRPPLPQGRDGARVTGRTSGRHVMT